MSLAKKKQCTFNIISKRTSARVYLKSRQAGSKDIHPLNKLFSIILLLFCFLVSPVLAINGRLKPPQRRTTATWRGQIQEDTTWQDKIIVAADIVVMSGATLTIKPGTVIEFVPSKSSKIDGYYFSTQTELIIRGRLYAVATLKKPIVFTSARKKKQAGDWAGIYLESSDSRVKSYLTFCNIEYAENAVYVLSGDALIRKNRISNCDYGIITQKASAPKIIGNTITETQKGIYSLPSSSPLIRANLIEGCSEEAIFIGYGSKPMIASDNIYTKNHYDVRWMELP